MPYATAFRSEQGIVASAHELASNCGAHVLSSGGNVVDAAIATSAVLTVVQNNSCGLGGDAFVILKIGDKVLELNASGRAAARATIELYERLGYTSIPTTGPLACITVPGLVSAWGELLKYATMDLRDLLAPAIAFGENGFPLNSKYIESIAASTPTLDRFSGWKSLFKPGGKVPGEGQLLVQKDLARSLRTISEEGTETFYSGRLSEMIVEGVKDQDGLLEEGDLRRHKPNWIDPPPSIVYHGVRIYETSPNSQGTTVLLWMNMLENYDLRGLENEQDSLQQVLIDTCLKAYEQRAKWIGDPSTIKLPSDFLSKEYANRLLTESQLQTGNAESATNMGDTTFFTVGDVDGNCVSMIQSNFNGFGSGVVPKGTGIVLHNRGSYFILDRRHHNSLLPGKRTFHTLSACLGENENGKTMFSLGTMGGDIQPQVHVQLLTKILDFKTDVQRAVSSPRWFIPATIYEKPETVFYEGLLEPIRNCRGGLQQKQLGALTSHAGHAQAILFQDNLLLGAADPRCLGSVAGS